MIRLYNAGVMTSRRFRILLGAGLAGVVALLLTAAPLAQDPPRFDLLITGATVVDGSGAPGQRADVAISSGRVAAIGAVDRRRAAQVLDASGLVVAPGFIDVHTHADGLAERPLAENFVRMGVTSIVAGNCGSSALDGAAAFETLRRRGASVNFATLIGHNTVRRAVMGTDNRPPKPDELNRMKTLVFRAMADGAVGFSTGLQYVPGTYAGTPELIELARVAGNAGGVYASHMRNEGTELEESIAETIRVGEAGMSRIQVSHLKVDSPNRWGASAAALDLIDAARRRGVDIQADQYAYTAASSSLGIRFPSWALEGGQARTAERLENPDSWATIKEEMRGLLAERGLSDLSFAVVASHRADPSLNGLSMKQVATRLVGADTADAQLEAARLMMLAGGASMVYHFMSDEDVERIMRHPFVGFASDAGVLTFGSGAPHPRGYGNAARVLGMYVRDRKILPLEEAVRRMTSLPAGHFRFADRGLIKEGFAADLVIFDPSVVGDTATFEKPHAYAAGIPHVIVNGVLVVKDGEHTNARPGAVLTLAR
jgi:N-acyl-D-amino-acid deacylase